jgi:hypothetical protein
VPETTGGKGETNVFNEPAHDHRLHRPGRGNPLHHQRTPRDHTLGRHKGILEGWQWRMAQQD